MNRKIINIIQNKFKISKFELFAVGILFSGLIIATIISLVKDIDGFDENKIFENEINKIARQQQKSYTGSEPIAISQSRDINNNIQQFVPTDISQNQIDNNDNLFQTHKKEKLSINEKININSANKADLMKLPGIGEKMANEILKYRAKNKFNKIEDIMKVKGIGSKKYNSMKNNIIVT